MTRVPAELERSTSNLTHNTGVLRSEEAGVQPLGLHQ